MTSCSWPTHRFREDDAAETPLEDTANLPEETRCPPESETMGACDELRHFPGTWEADGRGVEFCRRDDKGKLSTPGRRFSVKGFPETIEVRAGLSPYGVHVFVKVTNDPRVIVDRDDPLAGDAVEVFLRGNHDRTLTGALDADEGHHLVLTAPTALEAGMAARYSNKKRVGPLADEQWHSRRVRGGYEVELHYPWTTLGNQASPGMTMGFDVAVDVRDDGGSARAIMHLQPVASSPSCDAIGSAIDPACDDRTWCLAKAYVP